MLFAFLSIFKIFVSSFRYYNIIKILLSWLTTCKSFLFSNTLD
ncbi:Hypothetical protein BN2458_PEG0854 [Helicobacter typhlonius]|uniref:Uncharacterized protein n=1 Tax=Helicobacter typhlonius TaxID=76936 RepID=A0A0S4PUN8_9HELI|nr:Hypothetical protein BN2458_PEG0854 [Helicobacter typhlonius]